MEEILKEGTGISEAPPRVSEWRRFVRVFFTRRIVIFGLLILLLLGFTAVFAEWLAPYDPYKQDLRNILSKPTTKIHSPGGINWLINSKMLDCSIN